jgi:hypothetical protein
MLYQFKNQEDLRIWNVYSDSQLGGKSSAVLQPSPETPVRQRVFFLNFFLSLSLFLSLPKHVFQRIHILFKSPHSLLRSLVVFIAEKLVKMLMFVLREAVLPASLSVLHKEST